MASDPTDLDALVARLRARHHRREDDAWPVPYCERCDGDWPCDAHTLLDALDALRAERDEARRDLRIITDDWNTIERGREQAEAQRDAAVAVLAAARRWGEARDALMQARDAGCFVAHEKQVFADASRGLRAALAAATAGATSTPADAGDQ